MIEIWGFSVNLPDYLAFFSGTIGSFLGTLLVSFLVGMLLFYLLNIVIYRVFRRTESELDDIVLGITYKPLMIFFLLLGLEKSLETLGTNGWIGWAEKLLLAAIAVTITYWISKLFSQVAISQLRVYSQKSEGQWDDVLAPAIETFAPPLIYGIGILFALQYIGLDLTGIYVAMGGAAFIFGFALQDVLSNFFSGLALLVDAPFQVDDVIKLDGDTIATIKKVGLRVTHVYDSQHHVDIFIPNASFGSSNIINITRPTTDLAETLMVGVGYNSNIDQVTDILDNILMGHPDIFATEEVESSKRKEAIKEFGSFISKEEKKQQSIKKLGAEEKVNEKLKELELHLGKFSRQAAKLEKGGLNQNEVDTLQKSYETILEIVGLKVESIKQKWPKKTISTIKIKSESPDTLLSRINEWLKAWLKDPDMVPDDQPDEYAIELFLEREQYPNLSDEEFIELCQEKINYITDMEDEDLGKLCREWTMKVRRLRGKIERGYDLVHSPKGYERELDRYSSDLREWVQKEFKQRAVVWRDPDVNLINTGASSLDFEINYYVDNIKLEHWERADRIRNELMREIIRKFRENNIEIPFPQTDVWFRSVLQTQAENKTTKTQP